VIRFSVARSTQLVTHDFNDDTGADTTNVSCMMGSESSYKCPIHSAIFIVLNADI